MNIYQPKHFITKEFVPPEVYRSLGERSLLVMDYYVLKTADAIREWFNLPVIINDWCFGGKLKYRGFRPCVCKVGAKYSQHRFGRAIDLTVRGLIAEEVRQEILCHPDHFSHINAIEKDVSWVHVDSRCITDGPVLF